MTKEFYSFEQWCKDNNRQDLLDLWDCDLNDVLPSAVCYSSTKECWFKCPRGVHKSIAKKLYRAIRAQKFRCPDCNTVGWWLIDNFGDDAVETYWSDKNEQGPFDKVVVNVKSYIWVKDKYNRCSDYRTRMKDFLQRRGEIPQPMVRVFVGVNDIATTHPDHAKYFLNQDDTHKYSHGSKAFVDVICPFCGNIKNVRIDQFTSKPFLCSACGDGVSYPNKFVNECFRQLSVRCGVVFKSEKVFAWSKNLENKQSKRVYDFYFSTPSSIIVEAHGEQHYGKGFCRGEGARTAEEEKQNDIFKYDLAIKNGILPENYIVLDCRESTKDWIKKSIMESPLPEKLNFVESDIDWDKCNRIATSSYVIVASNLWNSGIRNTTQIAKIIGVHRFTIQKYLLRAHEIGLCDYDIEMMKKYGTGKPVLCIENGMAFGSSHVCDELSEELFGRHLSHNSIRDVARTGGYLFGNHFKYITQQEFLDYQSKYPDKAFGQVYLTT